MSQYRYFMVRLREDANAIAPSPARLEGVVERLSTGEKRQFDSTGELVRLLSGWSESVSNLEVLPEGRNTGSDCGEKATGERPVPDGAEGNSLPNGLAWLRR